VYDDSSDGGYIRVFGQDASNGLLNELGNGTSFTGSVPTSAIVRVHPSGKKVYIGGNNGYLWYADFDSATGILGSLAYTSFNGNISGMDISPDGSKLYVFTSDGQYFCCSMNTGTGEITSASIGDTPLGTVPGMKANASGIAFATDKGVYLTYQDDTDDGWRILFAYVGMDPPTAYTVAAEPTALAVRDDALYLGLNTSGVNLIYRAGLASDGTLTGDPSAYMGGFPILDICLHPTLNFLYTVVSSDTKVHYYSTTGQLQTTEPAYPFPPSVLSHTRHVTVDPDGKWLYVSSRGPGDNPAELAHSALDASGVPGTFTSQQVPGVISSIDFYKVP
jgi:WD40 repeat protein